MNDFLFDTHSHLDLMPNLNDTICAIESKRIYTIGVTNLPVLFTNFSRKINSKYIKPALGFHPELIERYQKYIPEMWNLLPEARYIGEVGLDFKVAKGSKEIQIRFFEELISRCNSLGGKILTVHSRSSEADVVKIIGDNFNGRVILHWYSGSMTVQDKAVENGAFFSINYAMTNSTAGQKIIANIPLERLLLESDSPFIRINKAPFSTLDIYLVVTRLAEIKKISYIDMLSILCSNFKKLIT